MRTVWLIVATLLAGCAGGGGAKATPAARSAAPLGHAKVTITIHRGAAASTGRRPAFISPSAQSIAIAVYGVDVGGNVILDPQLSVTYADLTPESPNCTGQSTITCTIAVAAPPGTDAFGVQLYAGTGESGALLGSVAPSAATVRTITAGQDNVLLPLVVGGVPAGLTLSSNVSLLRQGTPATFPLSVVATDGGGNIIVGSDPYANPITLSNADVTGALTLSTISVTSPATSVIVTYTGGSLLGPPTIGATVSGASTQASLSYLSGSVSLDCSSGCSGIANGPQPYPVTVQESGYGTQPFTLSAGGAGCTIDPAGSIAASGGSVVTNLYGPPAGGTCTLSATDIGADTNTANVTFVAAATPAVVSTCGDALPKPADPNGGSLYLTTGCGNAGVQYGGYLFVALDSTYNPQSFQVAVYANPNAAAVTQFTVGGNRYISGVAISPPYVVYTGQNGTTLVAISSLAGALAP